MDRISVEGRPQRKIIYSTSVVRGGARCRGSWRPRVIENRRDRLATILVASHELFGVARLCARRGVFDGRPRLVAQDDFFRLCLMWLVLAPLVALL
jgi:hypothetical protein